MRQIIINLLEIISPSYRVLNKSFFELNKRIDTLEYELTMSKKIDYTLFKNQEISPLVHQVFKLNDFDIQFKYNIFNSHDFSSIVEEIIKPNFYTNDSKSTYFWGDLTFDDGDVVVDIGGNIGMFSIPFAKSFPNVRVLCFEPIKQNFDLLKINVDENELKNVEIYPMGIAGDMLSTNFVWKPFHNGGSGDIHLTSKDNETQNLVNEMGEITPVNLIPFDSLFSEFGIEKIALLKMDCEGGEYDIMLRSQHFKRTHVTRIIGEVHEDMKDGKEFRKINNILQNEFSGQFKMDCYADLLKKYNVE